MPLYNADEQAMYQDSVKLQGQINALIKKYSDQKGEHQLASLLADR